MNAKKAKATEKSNLEAKEVIDEDGESERTIVVDWDGPDDPSNPKKYVQVTSVHP